jgi:hypothetical protein
MSTMKAMVTGFVERPDILGQGKLLLDSYDTLLMRDTVKRRPPTSLANYDIGMLVAWYAAVCEAYGILLPRFLLSLLKHL